MKGAWKGRSRGSGNEAIRKVHSDIFRETHTHNAERAAHARKSIARGVSVAGTKDDIAAYLARCPKPFRAELDEDESE